MRKDLDDLLCERHPEIFSKRHADPRRTCMTRGFSCDDGWFDLIDSLCDQLDELAKTDKSAVASQVKEKFGTLRFRVAGSDEAQALCRAAETVSATICEHCGATPASLSALGGIYRTRCHECYAALRKECGPHVFDYCSPDDIGPALLSHRHRVIEAFAEIFGIEKVKAVWAEIQSDQTAEMMRQVKGVLSTIEAKKAAKRE